MICECFKQSGEKWCFSASFYSERCKKQGARLAHLVKWGVKVNG